MTRPGTQIILRETPAPRSAPTDTGVWFTVGLTDHGPTDRPVLVTSVAEFVDLMGDRVTYSILYDALDTYFREGGNAAYVGRVVGPTPVLATHTLLDAAGSPIATLRIDAVDPGAWANNLNIAVEAGTAGGTFVLVVSHDSLGELERSGDLVDKTAAVTWASFSDYIRAVDLGVGADPAVVGAQSLAGGSDDRTNITEAEWLKALNLFTKDLGPGQVSMPGRTTTTAAQNLQAHAVANRRVAILDGPDSGSEATQKAATAAARTVGAHFAAQFAPWIKIPGVVGTSTRTVPPSGMIAGIIARNDVSNSPNAPSAGDLGQSLFALGVSQPAWTDEDRQDLNFASVNIIRQMYGGTRVYGWRSLASGEAEPQWIDFGNARLYMAIAAQADVIAERYMFSQLDGRGLTISHFGAELRTMCLFHYNQGSLFGDTPQEAFNVDVGPNVNTIARLANNELRAVIGLRMSPFAEMVIIELVKVPITQGVA